MRLPPDSTRSRGCSRSAEASHASAANPELQERELIKLAAWATALADVLRRRGVPDPAAALAAETGIAVFRIAWERWTDEGNQRDFSQLINESFDELKAVTATT